MDKGGLLGPGPWEGKTEQFELTVDKYELGMSAVKPKYE